MTKEGSSAFDVKIECTLAAKILATHAVVVKRSTVKDTARQIWSKVTCSRMHLLVKEYSPVIGWRSKTV